MTAFTRVGRRFPEGVVGMHFGKGSGRAGRQSLREGINQLMAEDPHRHDSVLCPDGRHDFAGPG